MSDHIDTLLNQLLVLSESTKEKGDQWSQELGTIFQDLTEMIMNLYERFSMDEESSKEEMQQSVEAISKSFEEPAELEDRSRHIINYIGSITADAAKSLQDEISPNEKPEENRGEQQEE